MPGRRPSKMKLAIWASAVPLGILIGSALQKKSGVEAKPAPKPKDPER
jgi:hypothetical protein